MTGQGGTRRRWRWAVTVWVVAVAVGAGLTLWLQDDARPQGPYGWESVDESHPPAPSDGSPQPYGDYEKQHPSCPSPSAAPDRAPVTGAVACLRVEVPTAR